MPISLVAGLGNPGREYDGTRHNIGFAAVDALARSLSLSWKVQPTFHAEVARWDRQPGRPVWLVKPLTFMNDSGRALGAFARFYRITADEIVAVYDEVSVDLGHAKLSVRGSAGGHNGAASLIEHLGENWIRYRLGVGPKFPREMDLKDFVLGTFPTDQLPIVEKTLSNTLNGLRLLIDQGVDKAMNSINRRETNER
ncbi:aminoacyl-tRNA hydrolase [Nibricoccus sp. IMCC34717]|uniref:aminoacyl-tRNA hydrolase n=1 Tax=Nibricoccus sp. IMCC34717 TaxID=3034021 RepID=UPI003850AFB1